jgi:hypothetical protein
MQGMCMGARRQACAWGRAGYRWRARHRQPTPAPTNTKPAHHTQHTARMRLKYASMGTEGQRAKAKAVEMSGMRGIVGTRRATVGGCVAPRMARMGMRMRRALSLYII